MRLRRTTWAWAGSVLALGGVVGCGGEAQPSSGAVLTIVSPHDEFIQNEFAAAFRAWHRETTGQDVVVKFQQRGGTSEIVQYVTSEFAARREAGTADDGIGIDVFFGGGIPAVERLKASGCTVAVALPEDVLALQPAELAGIPMRDPEGHWYGNVLTSFGIVYNKRLVAERNLPPPTRWADLASEAYFGRVILADPTKSASISVCFELILQKHGWERGWATLMRIGGNAREFKPVSAQVAPEVAQGVGAVGMCIEFYAVAQIVKSGADVVGYVAPPGETAITPDPIAVLRGSHDAALATRFVSFTMSERGQALWALPAGVPGGPAEHSLHRMPAIPSVYEKHADQITTRARPFADTATFHYDAEKERRRKPLIGPLIAAAFLKNAALSRRAWKAVIDSDYDAALVKEYEAAPFDEAEGIRLGQAHAADARRALELDRQWRTFFRTKYERILAGNP